MDYIILNDAAWIYYLINLLTVVIILASIRWLAGGLASSSLTDLLAEQDNFAVGIALSGAIMAVAILLMGLVSGDAGATPLVEAILLASYGILGMLLMWVARILLDKVSLRRINIHQQILAGNMAAAVVDGSHIIASAIMLRAVMIWVDGTTLLGMIGVLAGFVVCQLILYLASCYRHWLFRRRHGSYHLQDALNQHNLAVAIRFGGHRIGVALAVTSASGLAIYYGDALLISLLVWSGLALVLFIGQSALALILRRLALPGIDVGVEVVEQRNIAIASLEAAIYVSAGLALVGLFG